MGIHNHVWQRTLIAGGLMVFASVCLGQSTGSTAEPKLNPGAAVTANIAPRQAPTEHRVALVIGNAKYAHIPALDNSVNDARDMCNTLRSLSFEVICHEDVKSKREMKLAIARYAEKLREGSVGVFYYAGHGLQVEGINYMVPTGAYLQVQADVEDESISLHYLMDQLSGAKNVFNVVVLDACRNNPLSTWRGARTGGLAPLDAPSGTMVLFATAPGKVAFDGGKARNGMFTAHLLKAMTQPGLTVEEMSKRVIAGVQEESKRDFGVEQVPWVNSSYTGKFCFAGCEDPQRAKLLAEHEQLKQKTSLLESENTERAKRIAALEEEVRRAHATAEERTKQLAKTGADSEKLQKHQEQLIASNRELSEQTAKYQQEQQQLQELRGKLSEMEQRVAGIDVLNQKIVQLEREKAENVDQIAKLRSETRSDEKSRSTPPKKPRHLPPTF